MNFQVQPSEERSRNPLCGSREGLSVCGKSLLAIAGEEGILPDMSYPRSPQDQVGGIVYFGRMIDKIRLMAKDDLHPDLHKNLGRGFDSRCWKFLGVDYPELSEAVVGGLSDDDALQWCFSHGRKPSDEEIEVWNEYLRKCGWRDSLSEILESRKKENGFENRDEIQTMFEYIDADEGRL